MNIFEKITSLFTHKEEEKPVFQVPDNFEVTMDDINSYDFMIVSGKTFTSPEELKIHGAEIDEEIEKYKQTDIYKILSTKLKDLDYKTISINKPPYTAGDINLTLGISNTRFDTFRKYVFNPSEGLAVLNSVTKDTDMTLYGFIKTSFIFLTSNKVTYKKGETLEFNYKISFLSGDTDNKNKELTFINNVEYRNVSCMDDYMEKEPARKYKINLLDNNLPKILVVNLKISEEELSAINNFYLNLNIDEFYSLSAKLNELLNNRIYYIGMMYDLLVIKGTDREDENIYTSLKEEELTEELKRFISDYKSPRTRE